MGTLADWQRSLSAFRLVNTAMSYFLPTSFGRKQPEASGEGDTTLPRPTGPFTVGFADVEFTTNCGRSLLARLYYPSTHPDAKYSAGNRGFWLPSEKYYPGYGYYLRVPSWISGAFFRWVAGHVQLWAIRECPVSCGPLDDAQQFPLVILSHGIGGIRTTYSTVCCELASHGFIVGAIEHRDGSASLTVDSLGRCIEYQTPTVNNEFNFRNAQLSVRVEEVRAVLDFLLRETFGEMIAGEAEIIEALRSACSRNDVHGVGHSMGAATIFQAAGLADVSFKRVIGLDPWMYPLPANMPPAPCDRPTLVIALQNFNWPGNDLRLTKYLSAQTYALAGGEDGSEQVNRAFLTLQRTDHADHSDIPVAMPKVLRWKMRTPGCIEPEIALKGSLQLIVEFLKNGRLVEDYNLSDVIYGRRK